MIIAVYIALLIGALAEADSTTSLWSYAAVILFVIFVALLFRRTRAAVAILLPLVLTRLLLLLSLVFIAERFFIRELGITANGTTHACYFALLACAFLHLTVATFRLLTSVFVPRPAQTYSPVRHLFITGTIVAALGAVLFLIVTGASAGFALFDATDRFAYRADQSWLFNIIITQKPIICALLGFVRFRMVISRGTRLTVTGSFAALLLTSTLFGDKFLSLLIMVAFFFLPFLVLKPAIKGRALITGTIVTLFVGVMVSGLTYYTYSDFGNLGAEETSERLFGRFTGQGQLWYAVNNQASQVVAGDPAEAQRLRAVMLATRGADALAFETHTGIFQMVERFAPPNIRASVFASQGYVQFTGASEAYLTMVFGRGGMLILLAMLALGCGLATYYVYNALIAGSLFGFAVSMFIATNYYSMLNQGSFWQIFGVRSLAYIATLVVIDMTARVVLSRGAGRPALRSERPDKLK